MKTGIVIVVATLIGIGVFAVSHRRTASGAESGRPASLRRTNAVVGIRDIRFSVNASGEIGPAEQVSVRPEVNGRISTLPVDISDEVKKGSVLFTLDDKDLQTERHSRQTDIARSQLSLDLAKKAYDRALLLFSDKLMSVEAFELSRTEYELAKNTLVHWENEMRQLEDRITNTTIVAPFDCTVLTRPVSVGQAVSGSGGFNSGTEVLTIADLHEMVVNAHVNQSDVTRLQVGQAVNVNVESVPGLRIQGKVDRIARQTTLRAGVRGYAMRIALLGHDRRALPGMTASLSIPIATATNALTVPLGAIFTEQAEQVAYVRNGETVERRPVSTGIYDYDFVEVLGGLKEGDTVSLELPAPAAGGVKTPAAPKGR